MSRGRPPIPPGQHGNLKTSRRDGAWCGQTWLTMPNGTKQRVRISGASSEQRARSRLQERCQEYLNGSHQTYGNISPQSTIRDIVDDWLARYDGADSTVHRYQKVVDGSIGPALGQVRLVHLTTSVVEDFLQDDSTVSPDICRAVLSGMCADLVRRGVLGSNPVTAVKAKPKPRVDEEGEPIGVHALTPQDVADLRTIFAQAAKQTRSSVKAMLPDIVLYLLGSGTRIGEAMGTRWSDLELDSTPAIAQVRGQVRNVPGQGATWTPRLKTEGARRSLILSPSLVRMLKKRRTQQESDKVDTPYVFPDTDGGPRAPESVRGQFRKVLKNTDEVRWGSTTPKTLRATHATAVVEMVQVLGASRQLGHSRIDTVQQHYLAKPDTGPDVSAAVEQLLGDQ